MNSVPVTGLNGTAESSRLTGRGLLSSGLEKVLGIEKRAIEVLSRGPNSGFLFPVCTRKVREGRWATVEVDA